MTAATPGPYQWRRLTTAATTAAPTRLVLVRHGATSATAQRRYSGRADPPLSRLGLDQAARVAARLAAELPAPAAVLSSPRRRCVAVAHRIAAATECPTSVDEELAECDFGEWEGRTFEEVRAGWPAAHAAWLGSTSVAPPGGESLDAVAARVRRFVERVRRSHQAASVVVVSHTSPLKLVLRDALGGGDRLPHRIVLDPGGLSTVEIWPDGEVSVPRLNDTCHLATPPDRPARP